MSHLIEKNKYDLIVCAGDDKTDETMFKVNDKRLMSIKIGEEETFAKYRIASPKDFRKFLNQLIKTERAASNG